MAGMRGYCIAFLSAFDKHWNLALEDVREVWTRRKRRKVPALGKVPIQTLTRNKKVKLSP
jgi:small nuclear ribonucleoprotein (snRNP)-like protein